MEILEYRNSLDQEMTIDYQGETKLSKMKKT